MAEHAGCSRKATACCWSGPWPGPLSDAAAGGATSAIRPRLLLPMGRCPGRRQCAERRRALGVRRGARAFELAQQRLMGDSRVRLFGRSLADQCEPGIRGAHHGPSRRQRHHRGGAGRWRSTSPTRTCSRASTTGTSSCSRPSSCRRDTERGSLVSSPHGATTDGMHGVAYNANLVSLGTCDPRHMLRQSDEVAGIRGNRGQHRVGGGADPVL